MGQYGTGYGTPGGGGSTSDYGISQDDYSSTARHAASRTGPAVVSFENVSKHYGNLHAVDGLTLELRQGETVALLGPNGAGKSTSLDMLLALRKPTSGRITVFGSDPYAGVKSGRGAVLGQHEGRGRGGPGQPADAA